jgi:biotin operon repressor
MNYIAYSKRLAYLLEMIKKEQVSSPKVVAEKFGCSEKTIRNMINCLREKGSQIEYFKSNKKYFLKK